MSFEEIIDRLAELEGSGLGPVWNTHRKALREAIVRLRTHPDNQPNDPEGDGWIRVDDKLPKVCENVLAVYEDGHIDSSALIYSGHWLLAPLHGEVTHWRPLPEPPKEAQG